MVQQSECVRVCDSVCVCVKVCVFNHSKKYHTKFQQHCLTRNERRKIYCEKFIHNYYGKNINSDSILVAILIGNQNDLTRSHHGIVGSAFASGPGFESPLGPIMMRL